MQPKKISVLFCVALLFVSCGFFKPSCSSPSTGETFAEGISLADMVHAVDTLAVEQDTALSVQDSVLFVSHPTIYSDSVDSILFHPDQIRLFRMCGMVLSDSVLKLEKLDSIFNYPIHKSLGVISAEMQQLLLFVIEDLSLYHKDYAPIRQPFHPNLILEFIKGNQQVYYLISFGTHEVAVSDADRNSRYFLFGNPRLLARWAAKIFVNDDYYMQLVN